MFSLDLHAEEEEPPSTQTRQNQQNQKERSEQQRKENEKKDKLQKVDSTAKELGLSQRNSDLIRKEVNSLLETQIATPEMRLISVGANLDQSKKAVLESKIIVEELKKRKNIIKNDIIGNFSKFNGGSSVEESLGLPELPAIRNCFTGKSPNHKIDVDCRCRQINSCSKVKNLNARLKQFDRFGKQLQKQGIVDFTTPKEVLQVLSLTNKLRQAQFRGEQKKVQALQDKIVSLVPAVDKFIKFLEPRKRALKKSKFFKSNLAQAQKKRNKQLNRIKRLSSGNNKVQKAFAASGALNGNYVLRDIFQVDPIDQILGTKRVASKASIPYRYIPDTNDGGPVSNDVESKKESSNIVPEPSIENREISYDDYESGDADIHLNKQLILFQIISVRYLKVMDRLQ